MDTKAIREALDKATPGPWSIQENDDVWQLFGGEYGHMQILKAPKRCTDYAEYWPNEAESHLIANAPEWLRQLLDENQALQRRKETVLQSHYHLEAEIQDREKEIERLNKALDRIGFYCAGELDHVSQFILRVKRGEQV